jgi:hypothetical protein
MISAESISLPRAASSEASISTIKSDWIERIEGDSPTLTVSVVANACCDIELCGSAGPAAPACAPTADSARGDPVSGTVHCSLQSSRLTFQDCETL